MSKVGRGDFQLPGEIGGANELRLLHAHFKKMVGNLQETIHNLSEEQRRKEEARFQALQSQIRPHFLLNTLNSIKWSARLSGAEHVSRMINSLGKLLTFAMRQDREMIPLREELEFVQNYIDLQNVRFNNGIKLVVDVPETLEDARINKFTLQPLAENSIIHGGRLPETLTVRIAARERDGMLELTVSDDGAGVASAMLAAGIDGSETRSENRGGQLNGIGLNNIQERIRLHFGRQHGLTLDNGPNGGAVVRIVMPVHKEERPDA
jgi:sensor histidine kinase YesM